MYVYFNLDISVVYCPSISHIHNGTFNSTQSQYSTVVHVACDSGYLVSKKQLITPLHLPGNKVDIINTTLIACSPYGDWTDDDYNLVIHRDEFLDLCQRMYQPQHSILLWHVICMCIYCEYEVSAYLSSD